MKRLLSVLLVVSALIAAAPVASAKNLGGKFGLGYTETLGGVRGLDIQYYVTQYLGLEAVLGLDYISSEKLAPLTFKMALGGKFNIARAKNANFGLGLRFNLGFANADYFTAKLSSGEAERGSTHFNVEIPFFFEYFLSNHFSLHTQLGLLIDIIPKDGAVLTGGSPENTEIHFGMPGLMGSLGATFWF